MTVQRTLACAAALLVPCLGAAPADAATSPQRDREQVQLKKAQVAAQLDVLRAEDRQLTDALGALNADVAAQEGLLANAEAAVKEAETRLAAAERQEARIAEEIATLNARMSQMAIRAYVTGGMQRDPTLDAADLAEATRRTTFADVVLDDASETEERLRSARQDLSETRRMAAGAAATARTRSQEVADRLRKVTTSRDRQATFAAQLNDRIEARLAEAAGLEALDARLSAEIQARQAQLASQNRSSRSGSRGSTSSAAVPVRNVRGIWVHQSIADALEDLLVAADRDGITLGGSGYRDRRQQEALREANCPDPEDSPASECSPPTARPGQSMHEEGLAVDFTYQGGVISTRSSPAYRWLEANARRYGFHNLPSEPWHWSTNGN